MAVTGGALRLVLRGQSWRIGDSVNLMTDDEVAGEIVGLNGFHGVEINGASVGFEVAVHLDDLQQLNAAHKIYGERAQLVLRSRVITLERAYRVDALTVDGKTMGMNFKLVADSYEETLTNAA